MDDRDRLDYLEALTHHPGWRILREYVGGSREDAVAKMLRAGTPSAERDVLAAEVRGRDDGIGWVDREIARLRALNVEADS